MIWPNVDIGTWNTHGLNDQGRKDTIRETIELAHYHIAYLQETKMSIMQPYEAT
jgi:exonuclease III